MQHNNYVLTDESATHCITTFVLGQTDKHYIRSIL